MAIFKKPSILTFEPVTKKELKMKKVLGIALALAAGSLNADSSGSAPGDRPMACYIEGKMSHYVSAYRCKNEFKGSHIVAKSYSNSKNK